MSHDDPAPPRERPSGEPAPKVRPSRKGPARAEVISVGRDLLRGLVADENAPAIAAQLGRHGCLVQRITVVDDEEQAIVSAVREALERSPNLLVVSGGLGPAPDDRTLAATARVLNAPLVLSQSARAMVEEAYQKLARSRRVASAGMNQAREKLCRLPIGAKAVPNRRGIAPGVICRLPGGAAILCLPGSPDEMRVVLQEGLEALKEIAPRGEVARVEIESPTPDESSLGSLLEKVAGEFPTVWISSRPAGSRKQGPRVIITIEAMGPTVAEAAAVVGSAQHRLLALVGGAL